MNKDKEELILVPIPSLIAILVNAERTKGEDLTKAEVLEIRDNCVCMAMPQSAVKALEKERGYQDIDPELAWEEWLIFKQDN